MSNTLTNLYDRQSSLALTSYPFAIVLGLGGIGSWVALNLALSGKVQQLHLVDPDIVEDSNLNRTPFRMCDIGYPKVDAVKFIILERRPMVVKAYPIKTDDDMAKQMRQDIDELYPIENGLIIDCRDDIYRDFYEYPCKYYKVGYDGTELTIDGNPKDTPVWGEADGYRVTPSFICPSQLAANLVCSDALLYHGAQRASKNWTKDTHNRLNMAMSFDTNNFLRDLSKIYGGQ